MMHEGARRVIPEEDFPRLGAFWDHWGFAPWRHGAFEGVARTQRFVKDGFLGKIAEYHAWDCIVWRCGTAAEREALWSSLRPVPDVMTQRFLFLLEDPWPGRRIRSFWLGVRGFAEFFACRPELEADTEPRDLTGLVRLAGKLAAEASGRSLYGA